MSIQQQLSSLPTPKLVAEIERLNRAYRAGKPEVDDTVYDSLYLAELRKRNPEHELLNRVEPESEGLFSTKRIKHASPMLSTDKAYTQEDIDAWLKRISEAASQAGIQTASVRIRVTPKLDGLAGCDENGVLSSRGKDGIYGEDMTSAFNRGVVAVGGRDQGAGELVVVEQYFMDHIAEQFDMEHPRNFMVGLVAADDVKPHHADALSEGVCRFVPYSTLASVVMTLDKFQTAWQETLQAVQAVSEYRTDGAVAEVLDAGIREILGDTHHFHRWQLAIKQAGETAETVIHGITFQTGRTGRITPIGEIEPVYLSGANLSRVTFHTGRHLAKHKLGVGAKIRVIRSGEVIPKFLETITPAKTQPDMSVCPSCGSETKWRGEYLYCLNTAGCPAQTQEALGHFFAILGVGKGFGPAAIEKLIAAGHISIESILSLDTAGFVRAGFGPGQAANLSAALKALHQEPLQDWKILASMGIQHLGRGDSRHLLAKYPIDDVVKLTVDQVCAVEGFAIKTAKPIVAALKARQATLKFLLAWGFNIEFTPRASSKPTKPAGTTAAPTLAGLNIVFTGTFTRPREAIEDEARRLQANVQSGVNSKTAVLVCGEKVGATKSAKAAQLGVKVLTEAQYMQIYLSQGAAG